MSKNTALSKQRRLFIVKPDSESSSDSEASAESAEFSHIPGDDVPELSKLFIDHSKNPSEMSQNDQIITLQNVLQQMQEQQQQQQELINRLFLERNNAADIAKIYAIPDPIKFLPPFDGNKKQLHAWLSTCEDTLKLFEGQVSDEQMKNYVRSIGNKLTGRARDVLCHAPQIESFDHLKRILTSVLATRQELSYYKTQLWNTKMAENTSISRYYSTCFEIVQNIKSLAKAKTIYEEHWEAINAFIEEDALAAFVTGLREPYVGYVQAAKPEDMEAAYAFVCKFQSKESIISNFKDKRAKQTNFRKPKEFQDKHSDKQISRDEPMEVGSSRSKLTLNRKQINNNELPLPSDVTSSESEEDDEHELDLNFCWGITQKGKT